MNNKAYLILSNGMLFEGEAFGAAGEAAGEIVIETGMMNYLEALTDPENQGKLLLQTFPLIGNYGVIPEDFGSGAGPKGYIVKYPCQEPSNFRSEGELDAFLRERGIVGLCGVDTRALAKVVWRNGSMTGRITYAAR